MKKLIVLITLVSMVLIYTGCSHHYMSTKPVYEVVAKPQRPDSLHFWIDGDWIHNEETNTNVCTQGYWALPVYNRTFQTGYWKTTRRGTHWIAGRWVGHTI